MALRPPPPSPPRMPPPSGTAGLPTPVETDDIKPWTIRGVPPEERNAATAAAKRSNMNLGDWLALAIRSHIKVERNENRAPVITGQPPTSDKSAALSDVERVASSIRDLAAAGIPISKAHASKITRALVDQLPRLTGNATNGRNFSAAASTDVPQPPDLNSAP